MIVAHNTISCWLKCASLTSLRSDIRAVDNSREIWFQAMIEGACAVWPDMIGEWTQSVSSWENLDSGGVSLVWSLHQLRQLIKLNIALLVCRALHWNICQRKTTPKLNFYRISWKSLETSDISLQCLICTVSAVLTTAVSPLPGWGSKSPVHLEWKIHMTILGQTRLQAL